MWEGGGVYDASFILRHQSDPRMVHRSVTMHFGTRCLVCARSTVGNMVKATGMVANRSRATVHSVCDVLCVHGRLVEHKLELFSFRTQRV